MKEEIIVKFLNGTCSAEENIIVNDWLKNPLYKKEFDKILEERWNSIPIKNTLEGNEYEISAHEVSKFFPSELKNKTFRKGGHVDFNYYFKIAAVFLIFIISSAVIINAIDTVVPQEAELAGKKILKKEALIGQKLKIQLPDGTRVILNSGSALSFPEKFDDATREVNLTGEAFFEVSPDINRPFKVYSGSSVTTVIGTVFNINDRNEGVAEVTLTEGKVKVSLLQKYENDVVLVPGEMAIASSLSGSLLIKEVDISEITSWKDGVIIFKKKQLSDIFSQLENWYNVKIEVDKRLKCDRDVSGVFNNENLENILSGLSFSFDFQFEIKGDEVKIGK